MNCIAMRVSAWMATAALALSLTGCGYNDFQRLDEQSKSAWSEVLNQYQRRADLIPNLEATLKGGKNPTFVIGKPNSSMLLSRVFLDRTAGDVMPPKAEKPMTEKQKEALYTFIEGQPIPDELAKAALADTKAALTASKAAPKAKK